MPAIEIRSLTKRFGDKLAIEELDLSLGSRERLVLLGTSGAGKSTLLRLIAGLESPDAGTITIDGCQTTELQPHQRQLAYMSQDYPLYPQLSVQKNLEAALTSLPLTRAERAARCAESMAWFQIEDLARRMPSQLSGGQCQRVAFAKAFVRRPRLLLLDEPLSQVDTLLRDELRELIRTTTEHFDASLVLVTHDPLDAWRIANRIAILEAGRIVQIDAPERAYHQPTSRSAAELLSLFGINWLTLANLKSSLNTTVAEQIFQKISAGMLVGCRPEACKLVSSPSASDALAIPGVVEHVQCLGFAHLVAVSAQDAHMRCLAIEQHVAPGKQLFVTVPLTSLIYVQQ